MVNHKSPSESSAEFFWGEIAPCEHVVQIYEDDAVFFDALSQFVTDGIAAGEGVIVIATDSHLRILDERLQSAAIDIKNARTTGQFVTRDASEVMNAFLVEDWPDKELFESTICELLNTAKGTGRRVRAFGEIVAVMWAQGLNGATVNLEHLWHSLCQKEEFSLFCAYPKAGFTEHAADSIKEICDVHSRVLESRQILPPKTKASFKSAPMP